MHAGRIDATLRVQKGMPRNDDIHADIEQLTLDRSGARCGEATRNAVECCGIGAFAARRCIVTRNVCEGGARCRQCGTIGADPPVSGG